ncbi:hypothetical protein LJC23_05470 [Desulfovibrio sp. OttesenSCG-928-I05]|nr:hypothetical protein [Desulfovibrio sp. OttesenSCG-928-I05]
MRKALLFLSASLLALALAGCQTTGADVKPNEGASTGQTAAQNAAAIEVGIGMSAAQVTQIMGAADSVGQDAQGREAWTYSKRGSNYVYSADRNGRRVMIIDGYGATGSVPTYIVITFDPGKRVVDFTYQQRMF